MGYSLHIFSSIFCALYCGHVGSDLQAQDAFTWPNATVAAVCLTYDDGLDCHLDVAEADLDKFGFKGSFYCTGYSASLRNRMQDWRALVEGGHELGNHSLFHPCQKIKDGRDTFAWVRHEYDLAFYSEEQIRNELMLGSTLLHAVDGQSDRTYAYTCSDYKVGKSSYIPIVKELFLAARGDGPIPTDMLKVDLHKLPSWGVDSPSGDELINYVKEAEQNGTMAIFMFHSVGGGYLNVSRKAHEALLAYLDHNRERYFVAPLQDMARHIKKERTRLSIK